MGPLILNFFIHDIFIVVEKSNIYNFTNDNTLYSHRNKLPLVLNDLKRNLRNFINSLKANPGKFQFMILGKRIGLSIV